MDLEVQMKSSVRPDDEEDVMCGVCNEEVNGLDSDADDEHEEGMKVRVRAKARTRLAGIARRRARERCCRRRFLCSPSPPRSSSRLRDTRTRR